MRERESEKEGEGEEGEGGREGVHRPAALVHTEWDSLIDSILKRSAEEEALKRALRKAETLNPKH